MVSNYSFKDCVSLRKILTQLTTSHSVISENRRKNLLKVASVRIDESLTLKKLRDDFGYRFINTKYPLHLDDEELFKESGPINQTIEYHLLGSIQPVPRNRIMSAMPSLYWDPENYRFALEQTWEYSGPRLRIIEKNTQLKKSKFSVSRVIYVYVIDDIKSFSKFQSHLDRIVNQINNK